MEVCHVNACFGVRTLSHSCSCSDMFVHLLASARVASAILHDIATLRYWTAAVESISVRDCTHLLEVVAVQVGKAGRDPCDHLAGAAGYCYCFWKGSAIRWMARPLLASLTVEDRVFVYYSPDEDDALAAGAAAPRAGEWHERLLLENVVGHSWIVLSRDFDDFSEDFSLSERVHRR
eukprot:6158171-Amphidinium_carterae.3